MRSQDQRIRGERDRRGGRAAARTGARRSAAAATGAIFVAILMRAAGVSAEEPAAPAPEAVPAPPPAAAPAFDARFSPQRRGEGDPEVGVAGRVVERFAPPVAAPIDAIRNPVPVALTRGAVLRPCDTPGSGCQNVQPASTQVGVPPIVPGTRPPQVPSP